MSEINFIIAGVIVSIVNILTTNFNMPKRFSPIVAVVLGVGASFIYVYPDSWRMALLYGIAEGLIAVGFFSASKNTLEGIVQNRYSNADDEQ